MKYLILQNTMAPYRISLFNKLYEMGMDIEVLYMCKLESYRSWNIDESTIEYPYTVINGFKGRFMGHDLYWCPSFLKRFTKERDSCIVLGGAWIFNTVIITCLLKRIGIVKSDIMFWSEANYLTNGARKKNKLRDWLRRFVYHTTNAPVIVPGKRAIESFKVWGLKNDRFILLPNVIEENKFLPFISSKRFYSDLSDQPKFVLPVRLNEVVKGVINFFKAIGAENIRKAQFIVLGNGPDEEMMKKYVSDNNFSANIHFGGFCTMDEMAKHYMASDCLVLPSFSDPSPLSLVEGCCCSMPMLVSTRCGNHYETVIDGKSGYTFDPDVHSEIKSAFERLMERRTEWASMGKESRKLFEQNFKQDIVLKRFIESLS